MKWLRPVGRSMTVSAYGKPVAQGDLNRRDYQSKRTIPRFAESRKAASGWLDVKLT